MFVIYCKIFHHLEVAKPLLHVVKPEAQGRILSLLQKFFTPCLATYLRLLAS